MKSNTDLEQSKKLAKILPIESADMFYADLLVDGVHKYNLHPLESYGFKTFEETKLKTSDHLGFIPAWSFSALLELIPESIDDNTDDFSQLKLTKKSVAYYYGDGALRCGFLKDNFIDAVFQMICWLKENGKL